MRRRSYQEAVEVVTKFLEGHRMPARANLLTNSPEDIRQMLEVGVRIQAELGQTRPDRYSLEELVLEKGQAFASEPLTRDQRTYLRSCLARYAKPFRPRQCFYNAQMLLLSTDPENRLCYCEGFGVRELLTPHAWLALDGKVVDVTWRLERPMGRGPFGALVMGRWNDLRAYYGVTFPREQVQDFVTSRKYAGSLLDDAGGRYPLLKKSSF